MLIPPPPTYPPNTTVESKGETPVEAPAWWRLPPRVLADRAAYQIAGIHAQTAAARIAPLLDTPETSPGEAKAKPTAEERAAANKARAGRFRRWCTLTALSACLGSEIHLPQAIAGACSGIEATGGQWVGAGAAAFFVVTTWAADWYLRGGTRETGATPVSQVRRGRIPVLVVVRTPFASALVAGLGADGLLAAANTAAHHLF